MLYGLIASFAVNILLVGLVVFLLIATIKERGKLLDRIQARNFVEYKAAERREKQEPAEDKKTEPVSFV